MAAHRREQVVRGPGPHSIRGPHDLTQILPSIRPPRGLSVVSPARAVGTVLAARTAMRIHFDGPVVAYMTRDLEIAHVDTPVAQIARTMHIRDVSGVPILDGKGRLVGVVTRTDLIRLGLL